jgi:hypothetical protein
MRKRSLRRAIKPDSKINQSMQSIQTKYLPATNHLGARIKATCERGSITISYPYDLSGDEVHREAVRALVWRFIEEDKKQNATPPASNPWGREFVSGSLPDGSMAHIFI